MSVVTEGRENEAGAKRLSRTTIARAAVNYIDRHGAQGLTMRGLGQELGVEAMALYRYVSGREDLLEAVVAELLDGVSADLDPQLTTSWQGYLQTLAHAVRQVALDHPGAFPLVATRHPAAPWLRPPLRSLELVEDFLNALSSHGMTDEQVVGVYRAFSSFLLGNLLLEAAQRGAETCPEALPSPGSDCYSVRTTAQRSSRLGWKPCSTVWICRCPSDPRYLTERRSWDTPTVASLPPS
jgi:TetR/AcrR family tetracycline transcriptional repressor